MERDRGFNFKLLVPPRVNNGQVSAVRPQEIDKFGLCDVFIQKYVNLLPIIVNIPQNNCKPGQLYSKLFEEVEKIKCWKVKVDCDTVQKDRRLQENKRTIETQRKAIQELQFGNESLSVKLEEQISENEDLRNKNNATRNLCNILKDTFQRSAEKMHLFESEREETHHLFMENSGSIQVKHLQIKLQTKIKDKENELQKLLLDLNETQKHCKQLQEATKEQYELLKSSKSEQESLLQKLHTAEQRCKETENKMLKKQIAKENAKSSQLETVINSLHEESQNLKRLNEEDQQKLLKELESKSTFTAELENEVTYIILCYLPHFVQKLRLTTAEAIKKKDDTELKCQHKIADMVALMEKHKSQYDRMVEEKIAELDENKKKEMEAVAHRKSLELDLIKHKTDIDHLKQQLKTEITEKENMQKKLTDLKKEMSSITTTQLSEARNKQSPASNCKQGRGDETPKESSLKRHTFDFSKARKTPSYNKDNGSPVVMKKSVSLIYKTFFKGCGKGLISGTFLISYRIRTPPSAEKAARWGDSPIDLDPKSDSSDQNDLLTFASAPTPNLPAPRGKLNIFKRIQSPAIHKSPGNSLKLAAMKRMRDAGWTAVTGCDKKKKTTNEKIFA
uniref:Synaptonemal complex protein 1 n=1 Tax=Sander lucioperca TaxID=283035 RepID=A0A8D0AJC9_SANLU